MKSGTHPFRWGWKGWGTRGRIPEREKIVPEETGEGQGDEENEDAGVDGAEEVIELENGGDESEAGPEGIEKRKSLEG